MKTTRSILILLAFLFSLTGLHAQGNLDWWKIVGYGQLGATYEEITADRQCLDANGNLIMTGSFIDSARFDNTVIKGAGSNDIFLTKYGSDGKLKWLRAIGGSSDDFSPCVTSDKSGNIFAGSVLTLPAKVGTTSVSGKGMSLMLAKIDDKGNTLWVKTFPNTTSSTVSCIKTDASGNIYYAGSFRDTIVFGKDTLYAQMAGISNIFLVKFDSKGNVLWCSQAGDAQCNNMVLDAVGNCYMTGYVHQFATFGNIKLLNVKSLGFQLFIAKFNSSGKVIRAWSATGTGKSAGADLALGNHGELFVTGDLYRDSIYFNGKNIAHHLSDVFVAGFDTSFSFKWVKTWGGPEDDMGRAITVQPKTGEVIVAGTFIDTANFDKNTLVGSGGSTFLTSIQPSNGNINWIQMLSSDLNTSVIAGVGTDSAKGDIYLALSADYTNVSIYKYKSAAFHISGTVFKDQDKDGKMDGSDFGLAYTGVSINPGNYIVYSNSNGHYDAYLDSGKYKLAPVYPRFSSSTTTSPHTSNINSASPKDSADFGLSIPDYYDLSVSVANENRLRPGKSVNYNITAKNAGTLPTYNATVSFTPDSILVYHKSSPSYGKKSGNTYSWNIDTIQPGQVMYFSTQFGIPTAAQYGQNVISSANIVPLKKDTLPGDNYDTAITEVVSSYDPNEKSVKEANGNLIYTIQFQNTGNDTAFLIVVKDTLDKNLNPETFNMISSSSPCTYSITNGVLECRFENINLPEKSLNEEASQGFFRFSARPYSNVSFGTAIDNTADIFFDFNAAVATNTVTSILNSTLTGIEKKSHVDGNIYSYPNPFSEYTTIVLPENIGSYSYALYNELGKQVEFKSNLNGKQFQLSKNGHTSGIYLLRVLDAEQKEIGTMKLIMK